MHALESQQSSGTFLNVFTIKSVPCLKGVFLLHSSFACIVSHHWELSMCPQRRILYTHALAETRLCNSR